MAGRTPLPVVTLTRTALTGFPTTSFADAVNGNVFANDGATSLIVFNSDASNVHNLTVQVASGVDGLTAGPRTYAVPVSGSGTQLLGPFPLQWYGNQLLVTADSALIKLGAFSQLGP
jgi:hypothetical protein